MENWLYTVWFHDDNAIPHDQDYEWVACIVIEARTAEDAKKWGDVLSENFSRKNPANTNTRSNIEKYYRSKFDEDLPFIKFGYFASDKEIGW